MIVLPSQIVFDALRRALDRMGYIDIDYYTDQKFDENVTQTKEGNGCNTSSVALILTEELNKVLKESGA